MNKRTYCESRESIAYYSGLDGLEIKGIEYGVNDYLYCVSGCWYGGKAVQKYHRLKIQYDRSGGAFVRLNGYKIPLNECIRMGGLIMKYWQFTNWEPAPIESALQSRVAVAIAAYESGDKNAIKEYYRQFATVETLENPVVKIAGCIG